MAEKLHIDADLQFHNRIHKSATDNKVKQITDKAQGIIFAQSDVAALYDQAFIYFFVGGVLTKKTALTIAARAATLQLNVGASDNSATGAFSGLLEEPFFIKDILPINPTVCPVGWKLFEPPTRGGFDNTFKTYPIP